MSEWGVSWLDTSIFFGFVKYLFAKNIIFFGKVAENKSFLVFFGEDWIITSKSSLKPKSSISSASSKTKKDNCDRFKNFFLRWSFILPGVPINKLNFLEIFFRSLFISIPPIEVTAINFVFLNNQSISSKTWSASSLVGATINPVGAELIFIFLFKISSDIDKQYANVLPDPVLELTSKSRL